MRIRQEAGYGEERQAAEFARLLGIKPPSLHLIEKGTTKTLGQISIKGYLKVGANIEYLLTGRGEPMRKREIERELKKQTLYSIIDELTDENAHKVEDVAKALLRAQPGSSPNDPFKKDPPKSGDS